MPEKPTPPYQAPSVEEVADGDYPISTAAGTSNVQ
jgi:hypothetical protein